MGYQIDPRSHAGPPPHRLSRAFPALPQLRDVDGDPARLAFGRRLTSATVAVFDPDIAATSAWIDIAV